MQRGVAAWEGDAPYLLSVDRAQSVREYLVGRFRRQTVVPMGEDAASSPRDDKRWSGVALAMFAATTRSPGHRRSGTDVRPRREVRYRAIRLKASRISRSPMAENPRMISCDALVAAPAGSDALRSENTPNSASSDDFR